VLERRRRRRLLFWRHRGTTLVLDQLLLAHSARIDQWHEELLLPLSSGKPLLEAVAEEDPGQCRPEREHARVLGHEHEPAVLRGLDGAHRGLVQPLAEAHEHEEAEHGVPERLHHGGRRLFSRLGLLGLPPELLREHAAPPRARRREQLHPRRVQRLGDEVAAQKPPHGTVAGPRDGVAALPQQRARDGVAVGERGPALDQRHVRDAAVSDEDRQARPYPQRDDGAVTRDEAPEQRLHVGRVAPQQQQVADERQTRWARREPGAVLALAGPVQLSKQDGDEGQEEEGGED